MILHFVEKEAPFYGSSHTVFSFMLSPVLVIFYQVILSLMLGDMIHY